MRPRRAVLCGAVCLGCALICVVIAAGSDRLAPRVSIVQPDDAATVQGSTDLTVTYVSSSGQPVVRVDIWVDDGRMLSYKLKEAVQKGQTQFRLHTEELADGAHKLRAEAFDAAGHAGEAQISLHVRNEQPAPPAPKVAPSGPDLIPPTVNVRQPRNGARVGGRTQVSVEATDDTKVICVLLFVDDEWAAIQNYEPYNFDLETSKLSDGVHAVYACAFDAAQNRGESAKAYFVVDNARATVLSPELLAPGPSVTAPAPAPPAPAPAPRAAEPLPPVPTPQLTVRAPEPGRDAATSATRPGPELAVTGRTPAATERVASAPRLAMPTRVEEGPRLTPPVTSRAALRIDHGPTPAMGIPERMQVALREPRATRPAPPPGEARLAAVTRSEARIPTQTSATAYAPARSRMSSGQIASLPSLLPAARRAPVSSYSSVRVAPVLASAQASSPTRTPVAYQRVDTQPALAASVQPPARVASPPPVVRTDRGERYAMLPHNVVTVASPRRDTETTSSGQRVSSPVKSVLEAKHVIHLGAKSVPVTFDNELLRLRTLATERAGVPVGPFREIFEHAGGVVHWFPVDKRVTAYSEATTVELRIGDKQARVDDEVMWLELAPFLSNGRTMVPFTLIQKMLDVTVRYDPESGRIQITSNKF